MQTGAADRLVARLAAQQHGVVARRQLLRLGIGADAIDRRLRGDHLHRLFPGIYAVGHRAISTDGRLMAAVLAGGEQAVLSRRSAAALWGLIGPPGGAIEITTPHSTRSRPGLCRHSSRLATDEMTARHGIPVTTVSRTLFDLAGCAGIEVVERALREAEVLRLPERPGLPVLLARYPKHRGAGRMARLLHRFSRLPTGISRSHLEDRFREVLVRAGLPQPETNVLLSVARQRYEVDFLWRAERVIVELDGHAVHGTRAAFESDRARDRRLQAAGWRVVRITWRQLEEDRSLLSDLRTVILASVTI
jgi:hypothetical protein